MQNTGKVFQTECVISTTKSFEDDNRMTSVACLLKGTVLPLTQYLRNLTVSRVRMRSRNEFTDRWKNSQWQNHRQRV